MGLIDDSLVWWLSPVGWVGAVLKFVIPNYTGWAPTGAPTFTEAVKNLALPIVVILAIVAVVIVVLAKYVWPWIRENIIGPDKGLLEVLPI